MLGLWDEGELTVYQQLAVRSMCLELLPENRIPSSWSTFWRFVVAWSEASRPEEGRYLTANR